MALVMDAISTYNESLFNKFFLNGDGELNKDEMDAVVAPRKESGDELMANEMRENLTSCLNFDSNGDAKISISEYVNALRNIMMYPIHFNWI